MENLVNNYPDYSESYLNLANIYDALGELDKVEKVLVKSLNNNFNIDNAKFNL